MLPFRNIRDVLGLHAKVSPHKTALISYEGDTRLDMTYLELVGKAHQVANLLYDDLGLQRGDCIAYLGTNHENLVVLHFASWVLGASLIHAENYSLAQSNASFLFSTANTLARAKDIAANTPSIEGIIQIGGESSSDTMRLEDLAAHRPTTFLGDESGAKGADIPITGGNERTASLEDCAIMTDSGNFTQGDVLRAAQSFSQAQALMGNQNSLCDLPIHHPFALLTSLFAPIFVGGTVIMRQAFQAESFWRSVAQEKIHSVSLNAQELAALLQFAKDSEEAGLPIYGKKVIQQDIKQFRHFLCADKSLSPQLAKDFESKFGIPIIYAYQPQKELGIVAALPITLSWQAHQELLCGSEFASVGVAIAPYELSILDEAGNNLAAEEVGEIVYCLGASDWQRTGEKGFYRQVASEKYYFLRQ